MKFNEFNPPIYKCRANDNNAKKKGIRYIPIVTADGKSILPGLNVNFPRDSVLQIQDECLQSTHPDKICGLIHDSRHEQCANLQNNR